MHFLFTEDVTCFCQLVDTCIGGYKPLRDVSLVRPYLSSFDLYYRGADALNRLMYRPWHHTGSKCFDTRKQQK